MRQIQKSITEIEEMFGQIACDILGVTNNNGRVRGVWGSGVDTPDGSKSVANLGTTKDLCYVQVTPQDDAYNRQRQIRYIDRGGIDLIAVDEHTDVHNVLFVNYGANAYDCARAIRNGLFHDRTRRFLRLNHFALVTDVPAIRRVPELVNASWVNRVDVSAVFNQFVRLVGAMKTIEGVNVTIRQENGRERNFEVKT